MHSVSNLKRIRLKYDHINPKMCVYKIWFGDKFYIGSSVDLNKRMQDHYRMILSCFRGERNGRNSQTNMMNHLKANPHIQEGIVEILEFCKSEYELVFAERKHLQPVYKTPNCLNQASHTTRRINGVLIK